MAVTIVSDTTLSTAANTKTSDLVTGQYENVGKGKIILAALSSATGLNVTLSVGGITIINDQPIPWFGTTGTMSLSDNVVTSQSLNGGKVEMFLRNTTGAALTCDYQLMFEPQ
ncbi:MAG: hypothetical protein GON13_03770 [Nanoarchaeota archaeon]|nr:hypothetical protein [Nanoarchaeota archaeon]